MKAIYLSVIPSTFLAILALSLPQTVLSAIPDQASFLPGTMKEAPLFTPSPYDRPRHVSNNQLLFISQDSASIFYSLNLTVAWPATKPAWRKLPSPPSTGWWDQPSGGMSLSKDGSTVHFVSHDTFQSYNDNTAHWGPTINLTTSLDSQYGEHVVTDVDMGLVYSLGSMWEQNGDFVRSFSTFDPVSRTVAKVNSAPRAGVLFTQGVYSSTRKSLFYLSQGNTFALYEYSIASDTWTYVDIKSSDIPSPRIGACFTTANGGRTLIVAAGAKRFRDYLLEGCKYSSNGESYEKTCAPKGNIVLDDVYEFDVETSVWTKISTTPVGYFNAVCAVSGDSLILYGGYQEFDGSIGLKVPNSNVPSIFNLKTNNWVSEYAPS